MNHYMFLVFVYVIIPSLTASAQINPYRPDNSKPPVIAGMRLAWHDEFTANGRPDSLNWTYEQGFVRNEELQWYQRENAQCKDGLLIIEGRREKIPNPAYTAGHESWKKNRAYAMYTAASLKTQGLHNWLFGRFEIRARIDTAMGSWPAIWVLGNTQKPWPSCGEIDLMEFYRIKNVPTILANVAIDSTGPYKATWFSSKMPLNRFTAKDKEWVEKFHIWRMDWTKEFIRIYIDDELVNETALDKTINTDGSNPFLSPQYLLLNLAIGGSGGNPSNAPYPIKYEVDYVRVYQ